MERSPPTFVDGRLVIEVCHRTSGASASPPTPDLLPSLSSTRRDSHPKHPLSPSHLSLASISTSSTRPAKSHLVIPLRSQNRLAHRPSDESVLNLLELGRVISPRCVLFSLYFVEASSGDVRVGNLILGFLPCHKPHHYFTL